MMKFIFLTLALFLFASAAFAHPRFRHHSGMLNKLLEDQPASTGLKDIPAQWFSQKLDHFNPADGREWQQRFFVNDTFWTYTKNPVFLMIGGEGPLSSGYVTSFDYVDYAKTYGALLVSLEHRFYGESIPTEDYSVDNLQYLTSEQALADLAYFRTIWASLMHSTGKWIVFGGSYSGSLSAWSRLKYPHLFAGSISTSGPVLANLDFYQYLEVVEASLTYFSGPSCAAKIQSASQALMTKIVSDLPGVSKDFSLCSNLESQADVANFLSSLAGNVMGVVQYNNEVSGGFNIDDVCSIMAKESDPYTAYLNLNQVFLNQTGLQCWDVDYTDMILQLQNTTPASDVGGRSWLWQTCQEFGYFQTTDSPSSHVFGPASAFDLAFSLQICNDVFGLNYDEEDFEERIEWTNTYYGGKYVAGSNIFFIQGTIDPWHVLGVTQTLSPTEPAVLIEGTAHCANMRLPSPNDLPQLQNARKQTAEQIGIFLK